MSIILILWNCVIKARGKGPVSRLDRGLDIPGIMSLSFSKHSPFPKKRLEKSCFKGSTIQIAAFLALPP